ncbi:MAG: hypothetical protein FJW85_07895 [Actinobacteria bacterium]|nr:hypothetical protein [Actinomycetota bacterium]
MTVIDISAETWYVFMAATVMTTLCVLAGPVSLRNPLDDSVSPGTPPEVTAHVQPDAGHPLAVSCALAATLLGEVTVGAAGQVPP